MCALSGRSRPRCLPQPARGSPVGEITHSSAPVPRLRGSRGASHEALEGGVEYSGGVSLKKPWEYYQANNNTVGLSLRLYFKGLAVMRFVKLLFSQMRRQTLV